MARISLICAYEPCGETFLAYPSQVKEGRKYCSTLCANLAAPQTLEDRFWSKVTPGDPDKCWLWQASLNKGGYGQFQVRENGKLLHDGAHVASFFLHYGRWPTPGMQVLHTCDVRHCVNPAHLWEGTQVDNMRDAVAKQRTNHFTRPENLARGDRHGRYTQPERTARGERNGNSRLTDAQWAEALALWQSGEWTQTALGKRYGVNQTSISQRLKRLHTSQP